MFNKFIWNQLIQPRNFQQNSLPDQLHDSINWKNSVVAGSYALKQFTGDSNWESHDVDVMVACPSKDAFQNEANSFVQKSGAKLQEEAWFDDPNGTRGSTRDELFHNLVLGSKTYEVPGYDKPVQLICLKQTVEMQHPTAILNETSYIPSFVSYSMMNGQRIFHVHEKGREILFTGHGQVTQICASRKTKYEERGYKFY